MNQEASLWKKAAISLRNGMLRRIQDPKTLRSAGWRGIQWSLFPAPLFWMPVSSLRTGKSPMETSKEWCWIYLLKRFPWKGRMLMESWVSGENWTEKGSSRTGHPSPTSGTVDILSFCYGGIRTAKNYCPEASATRIIPDRTDKGDLFQGDKMIKGNVLIGQSGGPTSVINSSLIRHALWD